MIKPGCEHLALALQYAAERAELTTGNNFQKAYAEGVRDTMALLLGEHMDKVPDKMRGIYKTYLDSL